jgi:hypothetical protein
VAGGWLVFPVRPVQTRSSDEFMFGAYHLMRLTLHGTKRVIRSSGQQARSPVCGVRWADFRVLSACRALGNRAGFLSQGTPTGTKSAPTVSVVEMVAGTGVVA